MLVLLFKVRHLNNCFLFLGIEVKYAIKVLNKTVLVSRNVERLNVTLIVIAVTCFPMKSSVKNRIKIPIITFINLKLFVSYFGQILHGGKVRACSLSRKIPENGFGASYDTGQLIKHYHAIVVMRFQVKTKNKQLSLSLSAEGQVEHLIVEATSVHNLCQMYIGWGPFL